MTKKLSKKINKYHFITRTIGSATIYIGLISVILLPTSIFGEPFIKTIIIILLSVITALLSIYNFVLPFFIYKLYSYEINDEYILIKTGVLFRKNVFIPIKRIQHIEKMQGPIQTLLKITTVIIYTAGSNSMIIGIPANEVEDVIHDIRMLLENFLHSEQVLEDEQ
ncbi:MAG: PH domain-containing protein [Candidatus Izemoplasmatales bacterium]